MKEILPHYSAAGEIEINSFLSFAIIVFVKTYRGGIVVICSLNAARNGAYTRDHHSKSDAYVLSTV
jgi:hypothetical protein